jgi:hypothetical protein
MHELRAAYTLESMILSTDFCPRFVVAHLASVLENLFEIRQRTGVVRLP